MPDDLFDSTQFSDAGLEVLGRVMHGDEVPDGLQRALNGGDLDRLGRLFHSGSLRWGGGQLGPPAGTTRYSNIASESGAALGRGTLNLGAVPYDAAAGVAALGSNVQDAVTGRGQARPTWADQYVHPGQTGRGLELARLDELIKANRDLYQSLGDGPRVDVSDPSTFMLPAHPQVTADLRAKLKAHDAELRQRRAELAGDTTLESAALGAYQTGTKVHDFAAGVFPPSAADATGERSWYHPQRLLNVTLENAPQLGAQLALAYATGGASAVGGGAARAAQIAGFVGSGGAMELADATRSQAEGFQQQGMSELDALKAGAPSAAATAAVNTLLEHLDAQKLLPKSAAAREAVKQGLIQQVRSRTRAALVGGASEGLTEMGQELTSATMEAGSGANPDALDPSTLGPRVVTAGVAGFGPGLVGGGIAGQVEHRAAGDEATRQAERGGESIRQPVEQVAAGVRPQGGGVVGEVGEGAGRPAVVGVGADQAQSVPGIADRAKAVLAEAEAAGREDAAAGTPMQDLAEEHPEVARAYRRGYRRGQGTTTTTEGGAASAVAGILPAPQEATHGQQEEGRQEGLLSPRRVDEPAPPAGVERAAPQHDATTTNGRSPAPAEVRLEDLSNQELMTRAEELGVKPAKSRPTLIGRIRDAQSAEGRSLPSAGMHLQEESQGGGRSAAQERGLSRAAHELPSAPAVETRVGRVVGEQGAPAGTQPRDVATVTRKPGGSRLDAIEQAARQRLATRTIPRGRNVGASIIGAELRDRAIIAAVRVVKAGVRTAEAIHDAVRKLAGELGVTHTDAEHRQVFEEARRIVRKAGPDGSGLEEAVAAAQARHPDELPGRPEGVPDAAVKSKVLNTTGQRDEGDARTVTERQALRGNLRAQERAAKEGHAAGVVEGKAKAEAAAAPRETLKQRIARVSGMTDAGDEKSVSERQALGAAMKSQRRAAGEAWRAATREAAAKAAAKIGELRKQTKDAADLRRRVVKLVKQIAPPELAKRFLTAAASIKNEKDVDAVAERLLLALAEFRARQAKAEAMALVRRVDPKKAYSDDVREEMEVAASKIERLGNSLAQERAKHVEAEKKAAELKDANAAAMARVEARAKRAEAMDGLRRELLDQRNRLLEANAVNRAQREIWAEGRKMERAVVVNDTVANAERRKGLKPAEGFAQDREAPWLTRAWRSLMNRATVGQTLGGVLHRMMVDDVWNGESKLYELWMAGRDAVKSAVEASGLEWGSGDLRKISRLTWGEKAEKLAIELPGGRTVEATPAEWMTVYALLGDEGHGQNLRKGAGILWHRESITGKPITLGEAEADAITRQIPGELRDVVDKTKAWYAKNVTPLEAEAFREHFGFAMDRFDGYFRSKRVPLNQDARERLLSQQDAGPGAAGDGPKLSGMGAWKLRDETAVKAPYLVGDFFGTFDSMVKEAAARIHLNKTVRSLQSLLSDKAVQSAVAKAYGTDMLSTLDELATEAAVVFRKPRIDSKANRLFSGLQRNLARAYLKLNLSPALKNLGGVLKLGAVIDEKYLAPATTEVFSGAVYKRAIEGSAYLRYRHEQSAALRSAAATGSAESDLLGPPTKGELAKRAKVHELTDRIPLMEWADARATVVAWRAFERQADAEHAGWSAQKKREWVAQQTERAIRLTQNPTTTIDKSRIQARHVDDWVSLLLMFKSDSIASFNLLAQAWHLPLKEKARRLAYVNANNIWSAAVTAALTAGMSAIGAAAGGRDDEEKYRKGHKSFMRTFLREIAQNTLGMVPIAGDAVNEALTTLEGQGAPPELASNPVSRLLGDSVRAAHGVYKGLVSVHDAEGEKAKGAAWSRTIDALRDLAVKGSSAAGLPIEPSYNLARRFYQGATASADRGKVVDAAAEILKGDRAKHQDAVEPLSMLFRGLPRSEWVKTKNSLRESLLHKGPLGKLSAEERLKYLRSLPAAEREAQTAAYRGWVRDVGRLLPPGPDLGPVVRRVRAEAAKGAAK